VPVIGAVADEASAYLEMPDERVHRPWRRVVVKLSGEAFSGDEPLGISPEVVYRIASEIVAVVQDGVEVAAVVGGGNMFRGRALADSGIDRSRADYMGMLGTVINCLARRPVLLHRHVRGPAGARDRGRGAAQGNPGGRGLRC